MCPLLESKARTSSQKALKLLTWQLLMESEPINPSLWLLKFFETARQPRIPREGLEYIDSFSAPSDSLPSASFRVGNDDKMVSDSLMLLPPSSLSLGSLAGSPDASQSPVVPSSSATWVDCRTRRALVGGLGSKGPGVGRGERRRVASLLPVFSCFVLPSCLCFEFCLLFVGFLCFLCVWSQGLGYPRPLSFFEGVVTAFLCFICV